MLHCNALCVPDDDFDNNDDNDDENYEKDDNSNDESLKRERIFRKRAEAAKLPPKCYFLCSRCVLDVY